MFVIFLLYENEVCIYQDDYKSSEKYIAIKDTNIDFRRNVLIGEIFTRYFPEIKCFQPQLNKDKNKEEFKPIDDVLKRISKMKTVQNAWEQMLENRQEMSEAIASEAENDSDL